MPSDPIPNRVAFLALEPEGLSADELWEITRFARCDDCGFIINAPSLVALPEHRCSQRQQRNRAAPEGVTL